jgi:hypothetical protein
MASIANPASQSSLSDTFHIDLVTVESGVSVEIMMRFLEASGLEPKTSMMS